MSNPIDHDCQQCRAKAGERCKNYKRQNKQTCPSRGAGSAKVFAQAAARKNAKAEAQTPLFALIDGPTTAEREYWHWRKNVAQAVEHSQHLAASQALDLLRLLAIRRAALAYCGPVVYTRLEEHCRKVLPFGHWYGFWAGALTGRRVVLAWHRNDDRKPGEPAVTEAEWHQAAHMTGAEFYERFPFSDPPPAEVSDGGLAAQLEAIFNNLGKK